MKPFAQTSECLTVQRYLRSNTRDLRIVDNSRNFYWCGWNTSALIAREEPIDSPKNWQVASDVGLAHMTIEQAMHTRCFVTLNYNFDDLIRNISIFSLIKRKTSPSNLFQSRRIIFNVPSQMLRDSSFCHSLTQRELLRKNAIDASLNLPFAYDF